MSRRLYTLLLYLLLPFVCLRLWWRSRRDHGYAQHWRERFGMYANSSLENVIWLHAVSVGETRAAAPLIEALLQAYPQHTLLLTCMTPTGRTTGRQLFGNNKRVIQVYLPYDYPFAIRRFLNHFRPRIGVLLETELWPNLITFAAEKMPVALVNARLSEKSAERYRRWPTLVRGCLSRLHTLAAQSPADARRLAVMADCDEARITITGNLKFDIAAPEELLARGETLRHAARGRPILLAASTREGEELLLLDAFIRAHSQLPADVLLVVVPRHPQRFSHIAEVIAQHGLNMARRSALVAGATIDPDIAVLLGDSMGEMFAYYAMADIAYVGGSLLPFGGQNLIEACAVGVPVLIGPHTYNFTEASDMAIEAGAAQRVSDYDTLMAAAIKLFADPSSRQRMHNAGMAFCRKNQGATARTMALLQALLPRE